jgi:hypothetical protein
VFCLVSGSAGMWQEEIVHRRGVVEELLVLVNVKDRLYRYHSPEPLSVKMSQVEIAEVIRRKLISSLRFKIATRLGKF